MDSESYKIINKNNAENPVDTSKRFFKHRSHKCMFCEVSTKTVDLLNEHLKTYHCDLIFCCDVCNLYLSRHELLQHMKNHANETECNVPSEKSNIPLPDGNRNIISTHLKNDEKLFVCTICDCKFRTKRVLQNHNRSIHDSRQRNFICDICGKNFKTDSTLYIHKKIHSDIKSHQCDICKKSFRMKHHLVHHMAQHEINDECKDNLLYECNHCNKKFKRKDNLRKHLSTHKQAIEDFICHLCNAKMRQKRYLQQHMLKVHLQRLSRK